MKNFFQMRKLNDSKVLSQGDFWLSNHLHSPLHASLFNKQRTSFSFTLLCNHLLYIGSTSHNHLFSMEDCWCICDLLEILVLGHISAPPPESHWRCVCKPNRAEAYIPLYYKTLMFSLLQEDSQKPNNHLNLKKEFWV